MKQVDYGIDKPERVRAFGMVGAILMSTGVAQFIALRGSVEVWPEMILSICLWIAILFFVVAGVMLWSSKTGKFGAAWQMIEALNWSGREKVLDVGCGRGLLTIMAARKLPIGEVTGIDIWSQEQLTDNFKEGAYENAMLERVTERIHFEDGDATKLEFSPNSFDKVISSLALHSIAKRSDRDKAIAEMIRVLKPGGEIAILDILHTGEYAQVLKAKGMLQIRRSPMKFLYCLPTRYVLAEKKMRSA
jgi:SAM-dependent methyltransferase